MNEDFNIPTDSYFLPASFSPEEFSEENNFLSSKVKPENIFEDQGKDNSEAQLSSKILNFPFTLDSYQLIYIKNQADPELGGEECKIIFGNLDKIRYNEPILKLIFFSKDRKSPLNLIDFPDEMNSLKINLGIEFISIFQNKLFIQCENENSTNEAYVSLQKSSTLFDLLYDEERSINSLEEQNKGINSLFNSGKKGNNENCSYEEQLSDKKLSKVEVSNMNKKNQDLSFNNNPKNVWNVNQINEEENTKIDLNPSKTQNIYLQNPPNKSFKEEPSIKQKSTTTIPPKPFPTFLFPLNNFQKVQPQINPSLLLQMTKINPFLLQTALAMQNILKMQQINQKVNDNKDKKSISENKKDFNGKNNNNIKQNINNINNTTDEPENYISNNNNKESSTNSNTSSSSSKESSPSSNCQQKNNINNININFNIPNFNFGLFNGFNINNINNAHCFLNNNLKPNNTNANSNSNTNNNKNNNIFNNEITNMLKINDNNKKNDVINNKDENNTNLEQIVLNKQYKEYFPKNIKDKEKEKEVEFHTKSTRDYKYKYVSRYIVQIENEKNFPVTKMIIGNNGKLLRKILLENCINYGDYTTKIRLRGKGSGYKEGPKNEESKDPMELCLSSLNMLSYMRCSKAIENLLLQVYYQYYLFQCNNINVEKSDKNNNKEIKDKNGFPIIMKKILKYHYVVNRYNTLVKEEKRKKKEEELKQMNQNNNYIDKDINHV